MTATISVVTLPSRIGENAFSKPSSIARAGPRAVRSSSRMRSKISTLASTAMPIDEHEAGDAGHGQRRPEHASSARSSSTMFITMPTEAIMPKKP